MVRFQVLEASEIACLKTSTKNSAAGETVDVGLESVSTKHESPLSGRYFLRDDSGEHLCLG